MLHVVYLAAVLGALGDSISAGYNARDLGDNRSLSWSTGDDPLVDSHLQRLESWLQAPVEGVNVAVAGSLAEHLDGQVTALLPHGPSYVTLAIGANDVCVWTADDTDAKLPRFESDVRGAVQRLVAANPAVSITLAPVPDVAHLREVAVSKPGCQAIWDALNLCAPLLPSARTPEERSAFRGRWADANAALGRVAHAYPQQVRFDPSALDGSFNWDDISPIDCFHPSVAGQNELARRLWSFGR